MLDQLADGHRPDHNDAHIGRRSALRDSGRDVVAGTPNSGMWLYRSHGPAKSGICAENYPCCWVHTVDQPTCDCYSDTADAGQAHRQGECGDLQAPLCQQVPPPARAVGRIA